MIIPTHNRADLLPRAVNSALAQTFEDCEIIIVDDCSSDHTQNVIEGFGRARVRSFRHEANRGVSAARNTGIANARGEYIAFLDDDDELTPDSLSARVDVLDAASPDVGMCYGRYINIDGASGAASSPRFRTALSQSDMLTRAMALDLQVLTSSILVRAAVAREAGGFNVEYPRGNDANFACRIALRSQIVETPEVCFIRYLNHGHTQMNYDYQGYVDFVHRHMADFGTELSRMPRAYAGALMRLAYYYMISGQRASGFRTYWKGARVGGLGLGGYTIREGRRLAAQFLWSATPRHVKGPVRRFRNGLRAMFSRMTAQKASAK